MHLRQLKYFDAVARLGSFTAASRKLHVSQPALGMQVKKLEQELGVDLLSRDFRGVEVTQAGERLLRHAETILRSVDEAVHDLARFRGLIEGNIELGVTPSIGRHLMPDIAETCSQEYPLIKLSCRQGYSDDLRRGVLRGDLEMAFSYDCADDSGLVETALLEEDLYLFGPPDLIGTQAAEIDISDMANVPLVQELVSHGTRRFLDQLAGRHNIKLNIIFEVDPVYIRKELMAKHNACTVARYGLFYEEIAKGVLVARKIATPKAKRTLYLLKAAADGANPVTEAVTNIITQLISERIGQGILPWHKPARDRL